MRHPRIEIESFIDSCVDSQTDYAESHTDAGDGYSHLPREGGWHYHNCDDRLSEFMVHNEIDPCGLDEETIADLVLDNFEMVSHHMFSTESTNTFRIDSYAVGEIEVFIPYDEIKKATGFRLTKARAHALGFTHSDDENLITHGNSDCFWCAEIDASDLQELIEEKAE